jgi:hypothetical protein
VPLSNFRVLDLAASTETGSRALLEVTEMPGPGIPIRINARSEAKLVFIQETARAWIVVSGAVVVEPGFRSMFEEIDLAQAWAIPCEVAFFQRRTLPTPWPKEATNLVLGLGRR